MRPGHLTSSKVWDISTAKLQTVTLFIRINKEAINALKKDSTRYADSDIDVIVMDGAKRMVGGSGERKAALKALENPADDTDAVEAYVIRNPKPVAGFTDFHIQVGLIHGSWALGCKPKTRWDFSWWTQIQWSRLGFCGSLV